MTERVPLKKRPTQPVNGFAARSVPKGPCREFPGVDIDAIHYHRGAIRDAQEVAALMRSLAKKAA